MGRKKELTETDIKRVIQAIKDTGGNKTTICKRLQMSRPKFESCIEKYPIIKTAYEIEIETIGDEVEDKLIDLIRKGSVPCVIYYTKTKLRNRGYIEKWQESDKNPLEQAAAIRKYQRALEQTVPLTKDDEIRNLRLVSNNADK